MAIAFTQEKRKQRYLFLILSAVILVTAIVLWQGFFKKTKPVAVVVSPRREVKINFEVLENQSLKKLQAFTPITPFSGTVGRENPFLEH